MLNDLAIPKTTRDRFKKDTRQRRFASRLPEPQDEEKVFRFERVAFVSRASRSERVDYVALSDGEHQLTQMLGILCMVSFPNVFFFTNPNHTSIRSGASSSSNASSTYPRTMAYVEERIHAPLNGCLLTTHTPFVPSDMPRENVFIFSVADRKLKVRRPQIETYGTTFDAILQECFDIDPPISQVPRDEIAALMKSNDPEKIEKGIGHLGFSVEKAFLADRLRQLTSREKP